MAESPSDFVKKNFKKDKAGRSGHSPSYGADPTPLSGTGRPKVTFEIDKAGGATANPLNKYQQPPIPKGYPRRVANSAAKKLGIKPIPKVEIDDRIAQNKSKGMTHKNATQPRRTS